MNGEKLALETATLLQDQYLIKVLQDGDYTDVPCADRMRMAMCDALSEISTSFPVRLTMSLTSEDNLIARSQIMGGGALNICDVEYDGESVPYTVDHAGIHLTDRSTGSYEVTFEPEIFDIELDDDFDVAKEVGFVMVMHLVARNYCMMSGRTEEAAMYDSMYNDAAEKLRLKRRARIPARKFV